MITSIGIHLILFVEFLLKHHKVSQNHCSYCFKHYSTRNAIQKIMTTLYRKWFTVFVSLFNVCLFFRCDEVGLMRRNTSSYICNTTDNRLHDWFFVLPVYLQLHHVFTAKTYGLLRNRPDSFSYRRYAKLHVPIKTRTVKKWFANHW